MTTQSIIISVFNVNVSFVINLVPTKQFTDNIVMIQVRYDTHKTYF